MRAQLRDTSGLCAPSNCFESNFAVIEMKLLMFDDLVSFMPFSRNNYDVVFRGRGDRLIDRIAAV